MVKSNKEIVREFYEMVVNEKRLDLMDRYISKQYVGHSFPYVGMGLHLDSTSGNKHVITAVAADGPVGGKLKPGDEILMVSDGEHTWNTFHQLKDAPWALGEIGTEITVRVKREHEVLDIALTRGLVKGFDVPFDLLKDGFEKFLLREWPDLEVNIEAMVEEEDLVACFVSQKGHNAEFERHAVWPTSNFFKLSDGKIIEGWGVQGGITLYKQLGYQITPPRDGR